MTTLTSEEEWLDVFQNWIIVDCSVRSSTTIYLAAREDLPIEQISEMFDHDITTRFISISLDNESNKLKLGVQDLDGFNFPRSGVALKPLPQGLVADRGPDGVVLAAGSGHMDLEEIDSGSFPLTMKMKCINGYAYSVGSGRSIYKRLDIGDWIKLDNGLTKIDGVLDSGFYDMDAFSESDMYAVGGAGDIWHYDGTIWVQVGFPSNMQLNTVTCAGDGYVYVSGLGGTLWRGRQSTWQRLYEGSSTVPWNDVLWFEDKLWLASDYEITTWNGKEMVPVTGSNGNMILFGGHMDARDDLLVIASASRVMAYQHGIWRTLVAPYA